MTSLTPVHPRKLRISLQIQKDFSQLHGRSQFATIPHSNSGHGPLFLDGRKYWQREGSLEDCQSKKTEKNKANILHSSY